MCCSRSFLSVTTLIMIFCARSFKCELSFEDFPEKQKDYVVVDDMILAPEQFDVLYRNKSDGSESKAVKKWPSTTIPYLLDDNFTAAEKSLIRVALNRVQKPTCIKFDRIFYYNSTKDYIHIKASKSGCGTNVGFRTGIQIIHLQQNACMDVGSVLHELVHILGFFHMHTSTTRNKFISVVTGNIIPTATLSFFVYAKDFSMFNTAYDYESITHYGTTAFSKDDKPTIVSKEPGGDLIMGQRNHLSAGDVTRINRMYHCS